MRYLPTTCALASCILLSPALIADDELNFHADYFLGFSQGAYYGLMLGGVSYDAAWCVKAELAHAAETMGAGAEFQQRLEEIFHACQGDQSD